MTQGIIGGATSYEGQSIRNIAMDIKGWLTYTKKIKEYLGESKIKLIECGFWDEIPLNFRLTLELSMEYQETILFGNYT